MLWGAAASHPARAGSQRLCLCPLRPVRFIKSERSIILLNFCLSILASNILILVGQSRVLSKAGAGSRGCRGGCLQGRGGGGSGERLQGRGVRSCGYPLGMDTVRCSWVLGWGCV